MESKFKVFVVVAIAVLALSIGGSTFFILRTLNDNRVEAVQKDEDKPKSIKTIALGDAILTNIATEEGKVQHFAKIKISIGVAASDEKVFEALNEVVTNEAASIRNELITTIGEQTFSMLSATNGKEKLSDEIITRLNTLLDTDLIDAVYFEEYFVQ